MFICRVVVVSSAVFIFGTNCILCVVTCEHVAETFDIKEMS